MLLAPFGVGVDYNEVVAARRLGRFHGRRKVGDPTISEAIGG